MAKCQNLHLKLLIFLLLQAAAVNLVPIPYFMPPIPLTERIIQSTKYSFINSALIDYKGDYIEIPLPIPVGQDGQNIYPGHVPLRHLEFPVSHGIPPAPEQTQYDSMDYVIELAVFADQYLFEFIQNKYQSNREDTIKYQGEYIYSLLNGVQRLFIHPSLKTRIRIDIKKISLIESKNLLNPGFLKVDVPNMAYDAATKVQSNSSAYLESFCQWQRSLLKFTDSDTDHWDHACLITGLDLVGGLETGAKEFTGVSYHDRICDPQYSCSVVDVSAEMNAIVRSLAHEIGHSVGLHHDGQQQLDMNCFLNGFVMGVSQSFDTADGWSECSAMELQKLQHVSDFSCMKDRPMYINSTVDVSSYIPGQYYDANLQCHFARDNNWNAFKGDPNLLGAPASVDICSQLWCESNFKIIRFSSPLCGTPCGPNMGCHAKTCMSLDAIAAMLPRFF